MEASGAKVSVVNADFGAPDMSVPVGAAMATKPDVMIFFMAGWLNSGSSECAG